MSKALELSGQKFHRLTVIERTINNSHGKSQWLCRCDCGEELITSGSHLTTGHTKSCGCIKNQDKITHGLSETVEYGIWCGITKRTTNKNEKRYKDYGGRGIVMCERWRNFENFIKDMGQRPSINHSIDRIDNDKGYSPENCKWSTRFEQARNTRNNHHITIDGVTKLVTDWFKVSPIHYSTYYKRKKRGFSDRDALGL